ncbi:MAG: PspC domain-containing protein [Steroidobacteraceae bacterium]
MNLSEELERLQSLHERGVLTADEFARAKARWLGNAATPVSAHGLNQLRRSKTDRVLGGVCGGLGQHTSLPSWIWRVLFCLSVIFFGFGFLAYFLLWLFMPLEN